MTNADSAMVFAWDATARLLWTIYRSAEPPLLTGSWLAEGQGISGLAFQRGETLAWSDYRAHPRRLVDNRPGRVGSAMALPLMVEGRKIGVLTATRQQPSAWTVQQLCSTQMMVARVAPAFELALLYETAERERTLSEGLVQLMREAAESNDVERVLVRSTKIARDMLQAARVSLYRTLGDSAVLLTRCDDDGSTASGHRISQARTLTGQAVARGHTVMATENPTGDAFDVRTTGTFARRGVRLAISSPVKGLADGQAALTVSWRDTTAAPPWRVRLCETIASEIGVVLRILSARQEHAAQQQELLAIVEQMPSGVAVVDAAGMVRWYNAHLRQLLGREPSWERPLFLQAPLFELRRDDGGVVEAPASPVSRALRGEWHVGQYSTRHGLTGEQVWLQIVATPLRNEREEITGAVTVTTDMTARRVAEHRLRDLTNRLVAAHEEERRRLAAELHDELIQSLVAMSQHLQVAVALRSVAPDQGWAQVEQTLELARHSTNEARRIMAGLRPSTLDTLGLAGALAAEVDVLRARGWDVTLDVRVDRRLSSVEETTLYRIAQEALQNVKKHAGVCAVTVRLRSTPHETELFVADGGQGFDPAAERAPNLHGDQHGLTGMRERIAILQGSVRIASQPGGGTTVHVTIPHAETPGG